MSQESIGCDQLTCSNGVVSVLIGQCGNQLGECLFDKLFELSASSQSLGGRQHSRDRRRAAFFGGPSLAARCIHVDNEPRVVESVVSRRRAGVSSSWSTSMSNAVTRASGSGNNWARGFHGVGNSYRESRDDISSILFKQAEAADHSIDSVVQIQSLAGGTGSGLGSRLLHDEIYQTTVDPLSTVCIAVAPLESEVCVQHLNAVLSLSHFLRFSDAVFLFSNSDIARMRTESSQGSSLGRVNTRFDHVNEWISKSLAHSFMPPSGDSSVLLGKASLSRIVAHTVQNRANSVSDLAHAVAGQAGSPSYLVGGSKILTSRMIDDSKVPFNWQGISKQVVNPKQIVNNDKTTGTAKSSLGLECASRSFYSLRGKGACTAGVECLLKEIPPLTHTVWNNNIKWGSAHKASYSSSSYPLIVADSLSALFSREADSPEPSKSISVVSPGGLSESRILDRMIEKANRLIRSRAYLHQYLENGVEFDEFLHAILEVSDEKARLDR